MGSEGQQHFVPNGAAGFSSEPPTDLDQTLSTIQDQEIKPTRHVVLVVGRDAKGKYTGDAIPEPLGFHWTVRNFQNKKFLRVSNLRRAEKILRAAKLTVSRIYNDHFNSRTNLQ
jgi:hypothetical protein